MNYAGLELYEQDGKFYFIDRELAKTHDGKHANWDKYDMFLKKYELRKSLSGVWPHYYGLAPNKKEMRMIQRADRHKYKLEDFDFLRAYTDHDVLLIKSKVGRIFLTQPYDFPLDGYKKIEELCIKYNLYCDISYNEAWWYPGFTPIISISNFDFAFEIK